jgi:5-methylcytosine-specific restriction enzyme subunit McrC
MSVASYVSVGEFETARYDVLGTELVRGLERITAELNVPLFRFFRTYLQAQKYVGTVRIGNRTVQVLPKIYPDEPANLSYLLFLLGYTRRLSLKATGFAEYAELEGSLLEIWIRYFASELNHLLRRDRRAAYVEVEERASYIRGRLLVERMMSGRESLSGQYPCRHEVYTSDHLLNQTLKFCNRLLLSQTRVPATLSLLRENAMLLDEVSNDPVTARDLDRIHLNRLNAEYQPLLDLCRLLLTHAALDFRAGRITQVAFMFDMSQLFEEFIAEFLRRHHHAIRLAGGRQLTAVEPQHFLGRLFGEFQMKVDLRLIDESGRTILLDTKYKTLDSSKRHQDLSQADFYQMYGYGRAGREEHHDIVLLYPQTDGIAKTFVSGDLRLHIRSFDPRRVWDVTTNRVNKDGAIEEIQNAFSGV